MHEEISEYYYDDESGRVAVIVKEETGGELVRAIITIGLQATIELKTTQLLEDAREIKPSLVVLEVLSE